MSSLHCVDFRHAMVAAASNSPITIDQRREKRPSAAWKEARSLWHPFRTDSVAAIPFRRKALNKDDLIHSGSIYEWLYFDYLRFVVLECNILQKQIRQSTLHLPSGGDKPLKV
jgi:hypothetical protein